MPSRPANHPPIEAAAHRSRADGGGAAAVAVLLPLPLAGPYD
jgi:hypothetical protein